jgi:predicted MPP superfamily phosphohydrolase
MRQKNREIPFTPNAALAVKIDLSRSHPIGQRTGTMPDEEPFPRSRLVTFIAVASTVFLGGTGLVSGTWVHFQGVSGVAWHLIPLLASAAFIPATLWGRRNAGIALRTAYTLSGAWLGVLNFLFAASLLCWGIDGIALAGGWNLDRPLLVESLFALALLAALYGFANAAFLRVTRITVRLPHLPPAWQGKTVALVTDLHIGHVRGLRFTRRVIARLRRLAPKAVLIGGDLFDGPHPDADPLIAPWADYTAPRGVYFVTGNHDEYAGRAKTVAAVRRVGLRVLDDEKVEVDGLQLVGVHDYTGQDAKHLGAVLAQAALDPRRASLLLMHQPIHLPLVAAAGVSLQLSGHTHRGQFWPWTLLVKRIYGPFAYGLHRLGALQVYTSSGSGTWGPPIRVGTRSEIVAIRLEAAED